MTNTGEKFYLTFMTHILDDTVTLLGICEFFITFLAPKCYHALRPLFRRRDEFYQSIHIIIVAKLSNGPCGV